MNTARDVYTSLIRHIRLSIYAFCSFFNYLHRSLYIGLTCETTVYNVFTEAFTATILYTLLCRILNVWGSEPGRECVRGQSNVKIYIRQPTDEFQNCKFYRNSLTVISIRYTRVRLRHISRWLYFYLNDLKNHDVNLAIFQIDQIN